MSDAVRSYRSTTQLTLSSATTLGRRNLGSIVKFGALFLILFSIWGIWITRDSHPMSEFVPADPAYTVIAYDFLNQRTRWANSPVWKAMSPEQQQKRYPDSLRHNYGFEEWMLRHFLGSVIHVTGNDTVGFHDAVLVTRMTRLGSLLERVIRWSPDYETDTAGGLRLHYNENEDFMYTVRGRTLICSRDRHAIIRALTLTDAEQEDPIDHMPPPDAPMLTGFITSDAETAEFEKIAYVAFSMIVNRSSWDVAADLMFKGATKTELDGVFGTRPGTNLLKPIDGPLVVSLNTESPLSRLRPALYALTGAPLFSEAQWHAWETADPANSLAPFWTSLLEQSGKRTALTWHGFELSGLAPIPSMTAILSLDDTGIIPSLGPGTIAPTGDAWQDRYTFYNEETQVLQAFDSEGYAAHPVLKTKGDFIIAASDRSMLETYAYEFANAGTQALDQSGHLYVKLDPSDAVENWVNMGVSLAAQGLLKDHTVESFQKTAAVWWERASHIQSGTLTGTYKDGTASLRLRLDTSGK